MEIIFKEQKGNLFGSTKIIGIGKRKPELLFGKKAKELRESAKLSVEELAKEFDVRANIINKIEEQKASLDEKTMNKYINKFDVKKEDFFDLDLETLILSEQGIVLASYKTSQECKENFDKIMKDYYNALDEGKNFIKVDFNK